MDTNRQQPSEDERPFFEEEEEEEEEEAEIAPVLYTCIHKSDKTHCEFWDSHTDDPYYYPYVDDDTPCHFCGHRGTLRVY